METDSEIEKKVKDIVEIEWEFLRSIEKFREEATEEEYEDEINKLIDEHNDIVKGLSKQIDKMFFNAMEVNERQKRIIIEDLDAVNVFNYLAER